MPGPNDSPARPVPDPEGLSGMPVWAAYLTSENRLLSRLRSDDSAWTDLQDARVGAVEGARDFVDVYLACRQASKVVLKLDVMLVERTFQGIDSRVRISRCRPMVFQDPRCCRTSLVSTWVRFGLRAVGVRRD